MPVQRYLFDRHSRSLRKWSGLLRSGAREAAPPARRAGGEAGAREGAHVARRGGDPHGGRRADQGEGDRRRHSPWRMERSRRDPRGSYVLCGLLKHGEKALLCCPSRSRRSQLNAWSVAVTSRTEQHAPRLTAERRTRSWAAQEVFAGRGYHGSSIDEIAAGGRHLQGADLRALPVEEGPARVAARHARAGAVRPPGRERGAPTSPATCACATGSTPSWAGSRSAAAAFRMVFRDAVDPEVSDVAAQRPGPGDRRGRGADGGRADRAGAQRRGPRARHPDARLAADRRAAVARALVGRQPRGAAQDGASTWRWTSAGSGSSGCATASTCSPDGDRRSAG